MSTDASTPSWPSGALPKPVLPDDPALLQQMVHELLEALAARDRQLERVQHRLSLILQRLYGPRRERIDPDQLLLFADALAAAQPDAPSEPADTEDVPLAPGTKKRRGHGRRELPADLPRIPVIHDLSEAEKACPGCGGPRQKIGQQTSSQLDYQPASLFVIEHIRPTYVCSRCHDRIATPAKPAQPIAKGLPGPGLLAHVVTSKYADHLPLYRQERILERFGVSLSRSTMCDWMARAALLLRPLYETMVQAVLASQVVHTDDTPVPVQDPKRDKTKTGRLWVYLGDALRPYTVFDYTPSRSRDGPTKFLKDFRGYLQADAFGGYDGIYLSQPVIEVGCNAHARRKFFEAQQTDPARAHQALAFYRQLYAVERAAAEQADRASGRHAPNDSAWQELLHAQRLALRQEKSVPVLTAMRLWFEHERSQVLPKSPIGQAIGYALNHWPALTRYTEHGFLAIDNNWAEREMKKIAIGRKNWLFFGSDQGGQTAAILLSLVSSGQRHGRDPFRYLEDVLYRLPGLAAERLGDLLPDRWQAPQIGAMAAAGVAASRPPPPISSEAADAPPNAASGPAP